MARFEREKVFRDDFSMMFDDVYLISSSLFFPFFSAVSGPTCLNAALN